MRFRSIYNYDMKVPGLYDIREAHKRIKPFIHITPVMSSRQISNIFGCELFFKCENFQKVGAFKFRGATNAVQLLTPDEKRRGVVTHSSGNHAAALALAASDAGVKAMVVMPSNAPEVKKNAVRGYGAEITFCEPTQAARESTTRDIIARTGALLIHPYDNFNVICGQGTAALELLEEVPSLDCIMAPVGGGGLLSGTLTAARAVNPKIKVFGAEPLNANDAFLSFTSGVIHPAKPPSTIAVKTNCAKKAFDAKKRWPPGFRTRSESCAQVTKQSYNRRRSSAERAVNRGKGERSCPSNEGGMRQMPPLPFPRFSN